MSSTIPGVPTNENSNGSGVYHVAPPRRRKSDQDPIGRFWKHVVAVSAGLGTISIVLWFVFKTLLVTRAEYESASKTRAVFEATLQQTMTQFQQTLAVQNDSFQKQAAVLNQIQIEFAKSLPRSSRNR